MIHTIQKIFGVDDQVLTKRSEWAATFDDLLLLRDTPRTDCPEKLPDVPPPTEEDFARAAATRLKSNQLKKVKKICEKLEP